MRLILGVLLGSLQAMVGCGLDWSPPLSHFQNVDFQGHVHIVEKIGELAAGKNRFPIFMIFNSGNKVESSVSGAMDIPLLSCRIEQLDENNFLLRSPSGWLLPFVRRIDHPDMLDGTAGMKGVIDERSQTVTVWSTCGDRLKFSGGRLIELQSRGVTLSYIYSGNSLAEIRQGAETLLEIERSPEDGKATGIQFSNESRIQFTWSERPIVEEVDGRRMISRIGRSVSNVSLSNGSDIKIEFLVDDNLRPTLQMNEAQASWDPTSGIAEEVDGWFYKVESKKGLFSGAKLQRTKADQIEEWDFDGLRGEETSRHANGVITKRQWFTSGALAGKYKSFSNKLSASDNVSAVKFQYDEKSNLLRVVEGKNIVVITK